MTAVVGYYAFQLEGSFDVKDFFKSDSDFVVGLDKLDIHLGESGGEPAIIYIEGDLTAPSALATISRFLDKSAENPTVGKNDEGKATIQARPLFVVLDQVLKSDYARAQVEVASGMPIPAVGPAIGLEYAGRTYHAPDSKEQAQGDLRLCGGERRAAEPQPESL